MRYSKLYLSLICLIMGVGEVVGQCTAGSASPSTALCINTALSVDITQTTTNAGGIGTPTKLPAGLTASWSANTITISGTPTVSGTFNYSIPLTGAQCQTTDSAKGQIVVTQNNTVGSASSTPSLCINTALTSITHTTTGATGIGTSTGLPAGVTASFASNKITIIGTPTATGTFNYSIPLTGGCGLVNATGTIVVTQNNTVGSASSTPSLCINTALSSITHTTTGATGIGTATGLPAGVTATFASNKITISGTPTATGTFNYSIPLTGGCGVANATGTIVVTQNNTVGSASSTPSLCINTALTSVTHTTTGATGIGTATGLPAGVTASFASNKITISGTPTATGTFNYSIPLTGGCGVANATGTIVVTQNNTVGSASSTPSLCINTALTSITHTTTGATGIGTATGLPAGVTASFASNTITISGTPTATGTFNYSIPLTGGCGVANATGTIVVTQNNTVGSASSTPSLCINTALTSVTHTTTGATGIGTATGLPAGVTASFASNKITVSGTPTATGTFNYSIPLTGGCGLVNATGTIVVTQNNTVGSASSTPSLCINTALTSVTHTTTGATGIGTATGLPAGVTATFASNKITISGTPTATGTFNYSIPLTGGCGVVNATGTITVNPSPVISPPLATVCVGFKVQLTGSILPAINNPWISADPVKASIDNSGLVTGKIGGNSIITYTDEKGCQATREVTVVAPPSNPLTGWQDADFTPLDTFRFCKSQNGQKSPVYSSGLANFSIAYSEINTIGLNLNVNSGNINPANSSAGFHNVKFKYGTTAGVCSVRRDSTIYKIGIDAILQFNLAPSSLYKTNGDTILSCSSLGDISPDSFQVVWTQAARHGPYNRPDDNVFAYSMATGLGINKLKGTVAPESSNPNLVYSLIYKYREVKGGCSLVNDPTDFISKPFFIKLQPRPGINLVLPDASLPADQKLSIIQNPADSVYLYCSGNVPAGRSVKISYGTNIFGPRPSGNLNPIVNPFSLSDLTVTDGTNPVFNVPNSAGSRKIIYRYKALEKGCSADGIEFRDTLKIQVDARPTVSVKFPDPGATSTYKLESSGPPPLYSFCKSSSVTATAEVTQIAATSNDLVGTWISNSSAGFDGSSKKITPSDATSLDQELTLQYEYLAQSGGCSAPGLPKFTDDSKIKVRINARPTVSVKFPDPGATSTYKLESSGPPPLYSFCKSSSVMATAEVTQIAATSNGLVGTWISNLSAGFDGLTKKITPSDATSLDQDLTLQYEYLAQSGGCSAPGLPKFIDDSKIKVRINARPTVSVKFPDPAATSTYKLETAGPPSLYSFCNSSSITAIAEATLTQATPNGLTGSWLSNTSAGFDGSSRQITPSSATSLNQELILQYEYLAQSGGCSAPGLPKFTDDSKIKVRIDPRPRVGLLYATSPDEGAQKICKSSEKTKSPFLLLTEGIPAFSKFDGGGWKLDGSVNTTILGDSGEFTPSQAVENQEYEVSYSYRGISTSGCSAPAIKFDTTTNLKVLPLPAVSSLAPESSDFYQSLNGFSPCPGSVHTHFIKGLAANEYEYAWTNGGNIDAIYHPGGGSDSREPRVTVKYGPSGPYNLIVSVKNKESSCVAEKTYALTASANLVPNPSVEMRLYDKGADNKTLVALYNEDGIKYKWGRQKSSDLAIEPGTYQHVFQDYLFNRGGEDSRIFSWQPDDYMYCCRIQFGNGCQSQYTYTSISGFPAGRQSLVREGTEQAAPLLLMPNPAGSFTEVHMTGLPDFDYGFELINLQGKILLQGKLQADPAKPDHYHTRLITDSLVPGAYLVRVKGRDGNYVSRLIRN